MGNCLSASDTITLRDLVNRPGEPDDVLTAAKITEGLTKVASTLAAKRRDISIIAVGGAVNTLFLHSRASTSDVDFFYRTKTKTEDITAIIVAAYDASKSLRVGENWLNNHTALFIEEGAIKNLYDEAVNQNDLVFDQPGLKVYAAPWRYALAAKLDRLAKPSPRSYDMDDAVEYLARLVQKRGSAVKRAELKQWAQEFKFTVPTEALIDRLAKAYKDKKGSGGIIN